MQHLLQMPQLNTSRVRWSYIYSHSDASYLSEPKARSRVVGHYFLSSAPLDPSRPPTIRPPLNGPIGSLARILKSVMAFAVEVQIGTTLVNGQEIITVSCNAPHYTLQNN